MRTFAGIEYRLIEARVRGELTPADGIPDIDRVAATGFLRMVPDGTYSPANGSVAERMNVIADEIEVILTDRRRTRAKVIGTDPDTDLAVLRIELDRLPVITWGKSEQLQVGDQVLAIGNPFGVGQTVTSGIVSALGRSQLGINTFENFIQTDAAINPGNSGGALVDIQGNLMGINTAIYSRSGGSMGIGFAIPSQTAKQVLEGLVKDGQVTRGWIGVEPQNLSAELAQNFGLPMREAVVVTGVLQNGPSFRAGIKPGDAIVGVAGAPVTNVSELLGAVAALKPGSPMVTVELPRVVEQSTAVFWSKTCGVMSRTAPSFRTNSEPLVSPEHPMAR